MEKNRVAVQAARVCVQSSDLRRHQRLLDYGPLGAGNSSARQGTLWNAMTASATTSRPRATIIMSPKIWEASASVATQRSDVAIAADEKKISRGSIEPQSGIAYHYSSATDQKL